MSAEFTSNTPNESHGTDRETKVSALLGRWFDGFRRQDENELESSEDTVESKKKFKRLKKGFSRIFGSKIVHVSDDLRSERSDALASSRELDFGSLFGFSRTEQVIAPPEGDVDRTAPTEPIQRVSNPETTVDQTLAVDHGIDTYARISADGAPASYVPHYEQVVDTPHAVREVETAVEGNDNTADVQEPSGVRPTSQQRPGVEFSAPVQDRVPEPRSETVVERRNSMVPYALIGAEYLARKSDTKKIRTEQQNAQREYDRLKKNNDRMQAELQGLRNEVKITQSEQATGKQELRQVRESVPTRVVSHAELSEHPQRDRLKEIKESRSHHDKETNKGFEQYVPQKPKEVLETISAAAENNIAVERVLERSHEVKDDESASNTLGVAASSSSVTSLSNQPTPVATTARGSSGHTIDHQGLPFVSQGRPTSSGYKTAMKWGFVVAMTMIVFALIAYLM